MTDNTIGPIDEDEDLDDTEGGEFVDAPSDEEPTP